MRYQRAGTLEEDAAMKRGPTAACPCLPPWHRSPAAGTPGEAAAALEVQGALRYRLSRLASGEAWDVAPRLKLRVVKLMVGWVGGWV